MKKFTVKDIKEALSNLDETKEVMFVHSYEITYNIEVEYIKELKEDGKDYYKIII